jgi:4-carboxymuconolactone decarboxylase
MGQRRTPHNEIVVRRSLSSSLPFFRTPGIMLPQRWRTAMAKSDARYQRGLKTLKRIHGHAGQDVLDALAQTAPKLSEFVIAFAFGDIYARPQLSLRERQIATVASIATLGHSAPQLKAHIRGALNLGITEAEIIELLMQMAVYAGFPAAINAVAAAADVFAARTKTRASGRGTIKRAKAPPRR